MKKFSFKSIRTRLAFWFLILALTPLFVGIIITFIQETHSMEKETSNKLIAIRDLKVQQLKSWLNERTSDLKAISTDNELVVLEDIIFKEHKDQSDLINYKNIQNILNQHMKYSETYDEIFIINPKTGIVEISTNRTSEGRDQSENAFFTQPMQTRELYIKNIYYSNFLARNTMTFSTPIFCSQHDSSHIIGILVARVDLKNSLYALLLDRVGLGETGETLIVNKDVKALNELRWYENAPLNLQLNAIPAIKASQGETGITKAIAYNGKKILAAYTYIPQTEWGFIAKQDLYELNVPIRNLARNFIFLLIVSTILIILVVFQISKQISKPVFYMNNVAKKIRSGDYSARNTIKSKDELGSLADSINEMTASIENKIVVQQGVVGISEVIVGKTSMQNFADELLKKLMEITKSNMGTFYILNEGTKEFEHFTSVGANEKLLKPFSSENPEGEFGNAVSKKEIFYLQNIPEDTIFKFKTTAGDLIPKEIITIPIIIEDSVVALISLVNIHKFSNESLDIIEQSLNAINSSYSNLLGNERTRILAEHLSRTNQQLEAQSEELQNQTEELQQNSDELQEQNIELELQRKQVEEANRLKSEFLSNMSHELRTPLNSVMALSRVLMMQAKDKLSKDEGNYLKTIERNGKQLLDLINDILDLSKIEAGKMDVIPHRFSIKSTVNNIIESLIPIADEKGIKLAQKIPGDYPKIESDESRVTQILQNLIGNAIKFTEKGEVTVTAESDEENIFICVKDTGIGISQQDLPHIFDEFRQIDGSTARRYEGTGLGLAIAHKAVKMLGGDITVESIKYEGSSFTLTLPIEWKGIASAFESIAFYQNNKFSAEKKTVLVVDDEPIIIDIISKYLSREGYNVISASNGEDALELAEKFRPFAITLDVIMPEMDGLEALQKLKSNPSTANIPVIIVSVSDNKETGFALGAVGYVTKPINKNMLLAEIHKVDGLSPRLAMVVDDSEIDRNEISRILEEGDIDTIKIESGKECLSQLEKTLPDVLILDLIMPEIDGFEVLEKIRCNPKTQTLPVIIVTAKDLTNEDKKKLNGNVASILTKSEMTSNKLFEAIKNALLELERKFDERRVKLKESPERILLVEDNESAIAQIKSILKKEKYLIDVARGGQEAIDFVKHTIPDGIILDLMMPEIDGFQVLENIRGTKATAKIPVLILTAKDLTPDDLKVLSANKIQQLIHKGDVNKDELLFNINLMLRTKPILISENNELKVKTKKNVTPAKSIKRKGIPNILVVEDNPDNLLSIKAILKDRYNISEAMDGEQGLEMARSELPDLILLDIALPKLDGLSVVAKLKDEVKTKNIPVIAMTAQAMRGDKERIIEAGCDDYISKPVDAEKIINKIKQWLKN